METVPVSPGTLDLLDGEAKTVQEILGKVLSVSVGGAREFEYHGRPARSAIWKTPVSGRVAVAGVNLAGDDQADREAHGGPDKAVYAYAVEDARWWEQEVGRPFAYAEFGENLTTEGIDVNGALVGERWAIGSTVLEVSEPRVPCWRLGVRMNDPAFLRRFTAALRPGAYLRIVSEGDLGEGDAIRVVAQARARPDRPRRVPHLHARPGRVRAFARGPADVPGVEALGRGHAAGRPRPREEHGRARQ